MCTLSMELQHRIMRNIHLLFCQGTDFYRSPCLIREMRPRQEKPSFRDARTWIMILNHRGKRFLCRWTQCRRSSHLYFFLSSATPPAFCFHFFVLPRFFFSLSLSCLFFVLFCFRCRREEKRVTRGCFAQRLDAVARFFAQKIMAALWIYADEIV